MDLMTVLTNFGFPVFCVIAMGYFLQEQIEKDRKERIDLENQHKIEVDKLSEVIANNTIALTRLVDKLGE